MRKKLIIIGLVVVAAIVVTLTVFKTDTAEDAVSLFATAEKGEFTVEVTTTGELSAEKSTKIMGPTAARDFNIRNMTVTKLVEEGTQVKQGDYVADLDKSELFEKIQTEKDQLDAQVAEYEYAKIDTALTLGSERDKLINLDYSIEEKQLQIEQSQYEPPATKKKYQNELEKLFRDKERALDNYKLKVEQAKSKMIDETVDLNRRRNRYNSGLKLLEDFTIYAPQDGMVIYTKGFGGERIVEGSQLNGWSPEVAELPDLSSMISTTYINEVDIRKVKLGQPVDIGLDAFPDKRLTGKVTRVARVGQQNPNSDAKVFEVIVRVNESDKELRPSMTTSNIIVTQKLSDVVHIPLECLHVYNDSINYVIKKNGSLQEVKVGLTNSNEAVIEMGVEEGDVLYLSKPEGTDGKEPNLIPELNGTRMEKYELNPNENKLEDDSKWVMPDGTPMSPEVIQRLKDQGITDPSQMMRGGRSGQRPAGSGAAGGATRGGRAGQPNQ
ncbi:efflux RND transporter periplasmic adaptor subunit [uncultured Roseivirga sp.]|uniref:efflux RND transporter periplasmic adaptor subunit n=1 Tax=uncultured Roseivirga sp. TaxID=543088 RepID=UPI0030D8C61A|tara:strand:- start:8509 stop:9996 length:1488 start_codon:yes stop_codon:yes gene_type:complete